MKCFKKNKTKVLKVELKTNQVDLRRLMIDKESQLTKKLENASYHLVIDTKYKSKKNKILFLSASPFIYL